MIPLLPNYAETNESFEKKLVFHLGSRSGFFSEYNNMLLCMIYCLQHRIQFQLFSRDLSLGFENGWTDYFEPFCPETSNGLHRLFNSRFPRPTPQFKLRKAFGPLVKSLTGCDYLTYELWDEFRALCSEDGWQRLENRGRETESGDQKSVHGDIASLREQCHDLVEMTWRFKPEIKEDIRKEAEEADLPKNYLAVHIRRGDKIKENEDSPLATYMEKLKSLSILRDVLVMTDDYRIFKQLITDYPDWSFHTLENDKQDGYQHRKNKKTSAQKKRDGTIRFFAGIELSANAEHFVGTFSSNIGKYMGLRMKKEQCHAIDNNQWVI